MPAVTLGFEEIEDRLRMVRRRANLFDAQHLGFIGASSIALAAALVIVTALRGSAELFSATLLVMLMIGCVALLLTPWLIVRRWRTVPAAAALIDRRAGLQDRIVTLLAVRDQQPPARLAGFLLADTLALGRRWEPRVIVPRRVPRSVYAFVVALAALVSTLWLPRDHPPRNDTAVTTLNGVNSQPIPVMPRLSGSRAEQPLAAANAQPAGDDAPSESGGAGSASASGRASGDQSGAGTNGASAANLDAPGSNQQGEAFGHQLQQMIRAAFGAQVAGRPQQLAQRDQTGAARDRERNVRSDSSQARAGQSGSARRGDNQTMKTAETKLGGNASGNAAANDAQANQPGKSGDHPRSDGPAGKDGKGSGAGNGSAGGGLLATTGGEGAASAGGELKTFKITLTSFLQGQTVKAAPEPKVPRGRVADQGFAAAPRQSSALSDQQLGDDLMRKPEIPPEFEEIVRRVYSQRPES